MGDLSLEPGPVRPIREEDLSYEPAPAEFAAMGVRSQKDTANSSDQIPASGQVIRITVTKVIREIRQCFVQLPKMARKIPAIIRGEPEAELRRLDAVAGQLEPHIRELFAATGEIGLEAGLVQVQPATITHAHPTFPTPRVFHLSRDGIIETIRRGQQILEAQAPAVTPMPAAPVPSPPPLAAPPAAAPPAAAPPPPSPPEVPGAPRGR